MEIGVFMKLSILILSTLFISNTSLANLGFEQKLFTLEKSVNSENILVVHTQTDTECKFVSKEHGYVDFYWLMNGSEKKEIHPMIRKKIEERVKFVGIDESRSSFKMKLNELREINHDLEDIILETKAEFNNGSCEVKSILKLGASANYSLLNLKRTYCRVDKNLVGVPKGCKFLDLQGLNESDGSALKIRFNEK